MKQQLVSLITTFLTFNSAQSRKAEMHLLLALVVTGIAGLTLGMLCFSSQVAVEQGQVLAGLVHYPTNSPTYIYDAKLWNVWAQLSALGLSIGFSTKAISAVLSALSGLLITWNFTLWLWALTKNIAFTIIAPLVCINLVLHMASSGLPIGYSYPIMILGQRHTYGVLGLSFISLVLATMIARYFRIGFLLLGVSLCIHPSLGIWLNLTALGTVLLDFKNWRCWIGPGKYLLAGYAISIASYLFQRLAYPVVSLDPTTAQHYLNAYLLYWDYHRSADLLAQTFRQPLALVTLINVGLLALVLWRLHRLKIMEYLVVIIALGTIFTLIANIPSPISSLIAILQPTRYFNIVVPIYVALLFSAWVLYREDRWLNVLFIVLLFLSLFIVLLFFYFLSVFSFQAFIWFIIPLLMIVRLILLSNPSSRLLWATSIGISIYTVIALLLIFGDFQPIELGLFILCVVAINCMLWNFPEINFNLRMIREPFQILRNRILALVIAGNILSLPFMTFHVDWIPPYSAADTPIWTEVSRGQGMLLLGIPAAGIELATGRANFFSAALDGLPYAIEGAPQAANILKEIYEIDFFNPPPELRHLGIYPLESNYYGQVNQTTPVIERIKALWENRTPQQWAVLAQRFEFTQVLTYIDWHLQLPVVATAGNYVLYDVSSIIISKSMGT